MGRLTSLVSHSHNYMIGLRPLTWQIYIDSRTGRGYTPSVHTGTLSQHPALKQHTTLQLQNGCTLFPENALKIRVHWVAHCISKYFMRFGSMLSSTARQMYILHGLYVLPWVWQLSSVHWNDLCKRNVNKNRQY